MGARISLDLRERIIRSYDKKEGTREEIAERYQVSEGMVKKLIQQRKKIGSISHQSHRCGRKPCLTQEMRDQIREVVERKKDITLENIRNQLNLTCSLMTIDRVLKAMGYTYKKNATRERTATRGCR